MVFLRFQQHCSLALTCCVLTLIYALNYESSVLSLALLNGALVAVFVPACCLWNFLSLHSFLVKPPLISDIEPTEETHGSQDDELESPALVGRTLIDPRPKKPEIEDQQSPLVFGEVLPKGCAAPKLIAESARSLCLTYNKLNSVMLVRIVRMNAETYLDGGVNEIFISRALHSLRRRNGRNRTYGFCRRMVGVFVRDRIPRQLLEARRKEYGVEADLNESFFSMHHVNEYGDFLYLEYASGGERLINVRFREMKQVASVVVQVALTLAVAEAALEFEHRYLEMDSVMVMTTLETYVEFVLDGCRIVVPTFGMVTRIGNYGKARASHEGATYYSNLASRLTDPNFADAASWFGYGFALGHLHPSWQLYKPLTNVMYFAQLLGDIAFCLSYEQDFTDSEMYHLCNLRSALLSTKWKSMTEVVHDCLEFRNLIPTQRCY